MNPTTKVAAFVVILAASSLVWAEDQVVKSRDGVCQVSAPAGWTVTAILGSASSPDKQLSVTVSSPKMVDSFAELKQTAHGVYKNSKVTKDSSKEFQMEGESITGTPDVYRAIPAGGNKFCIVEVTYKRGPVEDARKIVETMKPVK